jgi:hypothetical protein
VTRRIRLSGWLDTGQFADTLGLSTHTIERWRVTGIGPPAHDLGADDVRYRADEIAEYVAKLGVTNEPGELETQCSHGNPRRPARREPRRRRQDHRRRTDDRAPTFGLSPGPPRRGSADRAIRHPSAVAFVLRPWRTCSSSSPRFVGFGSYRPQRGDLDVTNSRISVLRLRRGSVAGDERGSSIRGSRLTPGGDENVSTPRSAARLAERVGR